MTPSLIRTAFAAALAVGALSSAAAGDFRYTSLDFPGARNTVLYAVNNRGEVVGAETEPTRIHHAIVGVRAGDSTRLALLDPTGPVGTATQSWAFSVNDHGDIAGMYIDASNQRHGYVLHGGASFEMIDVPGALSTEAYGVNDEGWVIGLYTDAAGAQHAFLREHGTYRMLDVPGAVATIPLSINDHGQIAGEVVKTPDTNGFGLIEQRDGRYTLSSAPGAAPEQTFFISINNRQQVLGAYADAAGNQFNFVREGDEFRPFDLPAAFGAQFISAQTINDHGDIVGYYFGANGVAHAFVAAR